MAMGRHGPHGVVDQRIVWIELDRLLHRVVGLTAQVLLDAHHPEQKMDGGACRIERTGVRQIAERALEVLQCDRRARQFHQQRRRRALNLDGTLEELAGVGGTAAADVDRRQRSKPARGHQPALRQSLEHQRGHAVSAAGRQHRQDGKDISLGQCRISGQRLDDALRAGRVPEARRSAASTAWVRGRRPMSSGNRSSIARLAANCPSSASTNPLWNKPSTLRGSTSSSWR